MNQQSYERIIFLSAICRTLIQLAVLPGMWKVLFAEKTTKKMAGLFAVLLFVNVGAEFVAENTWNRYILSAILIMGYLLLVNRQEWERGAFLLLLFYAFHTSAFLLANSLYQYWIDIFQGMLDPYAADFQNQIYRQAAIGQAAMVLLYGIFLLGHGLLFRKAGKDLPSMDMTEFLFLSVINMVEIVFVHMMMDLLIVKLESEVFMLFEVRRETLWKLPLMGCLLTAGEFSLLFVWKNYRRLLMERQKNLVREEQLKQLKERFEKVDAFYGDIRRLRHEMRNHMMNIKGLITREQYGEVETYMEELDAAVQKLDFTYSTGNPVCDVIINEKYMEARRFRIAMEVTFVWQETENISVFDFGILLSNLLDNAIEACRKVSEEKRFIHLSLKRRAPFLLLEVKNPYDGSLVWDEQRKLPLSTKNSDGGQETLAEHGLGLKNVEQIADQYFGGIQIEADEGVFCITVMLQAKKF